MMPEHDCRKTVYAGYDQVKDLITVGCTECDYRFIVLEATPDGAENEIDDGFCLRTIGEELVYQLYMKDMGDVWTKLVERISKAQHITKEQVEQGTIRMVSSERLNHPPEDAIG